MALKSKADALAPQVPTSSTFEQPPTYCLPDEPPIPVSEPKPRRNRRHDRQISRLPLSQRLVEAQQSASVSLAWARNHAQDGNDQAADVSLEWAAFHGTRAAILKAMKESSNV